jgi:hypothetical protein
MQRAARALLGGDHHFLIRQSASNLRSDRGMGQHIVDDNGQTHLCTDLAVIVDHRRSVRVLVDRRRHHRAADPCVTGGPSARDRVARRGRDNPRYNRHRPADLVDRDPAKLGKFVDA